MNTLYASGEYDSRGEEPGLNQPAIVEGEDTGYESRVFQLRAVATNSEMHDFARDLFGDLEDYGGGYQVIGGMNLPQGESQITVVAWSTAGFEGMFPQS